MTYSNCYSPENSRKNDRQCCYLSRRWGGAAPHRPLPAKIERAAYGIPFTEKVQAALPPVRGDGAGLLHAGPTRED
ncbi:hypothetical protein [Chitinophaga sp. HK235]|uniref:hypothetical protein n=1 Tax=Chitinophaga sp. HK235 TaxID=2952571 RepID=UPI001BABA9AD|nr:hypothetical protein [Chitinophaga sp. HK235]